MDEVRARKIAKLNDTVRQTFAGGIISLTAGVIGLPDDQRLLVLQKVQQFDEFTPDNDPYGEHDFGLIQVGRVRIFFKFDYYDLSLSRHSDPASVSQTRRVLTIMLAEEY